jgi:uncharacterized protein
MTKIKQQLVVVLGASDKAHRYSCQAISLLTQYGHQVIPVHPKLSVIDGINVISHLSQINEKVDTLTLYIGPERSLQLIDDIVSLKPRRVIFNPGSESVEMEKKLTHAAIPFIHDCTLIMLNNKQFELISA